MGIPFTLPMGFLFTVIMGILLTISALYSPVDIVP
jgi:hypothetical protein